MIAKSFNPIKTLSCPSSRVEKTMNLAYVPFLDEECVKNIACPSARIEKSTELAYDYIFFDKECVDFLCNSKKFQPIKDIMTRLSVRVGKSTESA